MLSLLPGEIITLILSNLCKQDLGQCALSCRYIRPFSQAALFKSICIKRDSNCIERDNNDLALQFFRENTALAAYVQQVDCRNGNSIMEQWILALFVNLRSINLCVGLGHYVQLPVNIRCQTTLEKLEMMDFSTAYTLSMLQSTTYSALTSLKISWDKSRTAADYQQLIPLLNNTPAVKELELCAVPLSNNQLDQLHQTLPRLKNLTLGINALLKNDQQGTAAIVPQPPVVNCLESFQLNVFSSSMDYFPVIEGLGAIIMKYLNYINRNYHHLTSLIFYFEAFDVEELTILGQAPFDFNHAQQLMRNIVYRQENFRLIEAEFFPYTETDVAACERYQFNTVNLWDTYMDIESQMMNLHNSTLVNSINKIHMYLEDDREVYQDANVFKKMLVDHQWMHLTKLEINVSYFAEKSMKYILPLYLLRYLPKLEALAVDYIVIRDQDMPALKQTRLKSFKIYHVAVEDFQMANKFFDILLSACPLLEYLDLELALRKTGNHACLLLDMKEHCTRLKRFDFFYLNLGTIFLLNNDSEQPQRYWSSLTEERNAPTDDEKYIMIDLRWNQGTEVKMQNFRY